MREPRSLHFRGPFLHGWQLKLSQCLLRDEVVIGVPMLPSARCYRFPSFSPYFKIVICFVSSYLQPLHNQTRSYKASIKILFSTYRHFANYHSQWHPPTPITPSLKQKHSLLFHSTYGHHLSHQHNNNQPQPPKCPPPKPTIPPPLAAVQTLTSPPVSKPLSRQHLPTPTPPTKLAVGPQSGNRVCRVVRLVLIARNINMS